MRMKPTTVETVIDTLNTAAEWGTVNPKHLFDLASSLQKYGVDHDGCCPVCEEVTCDSGCPLLTVRDINWRSSPDGEAQPFSSQLEASAQSSAARVRELEAYNEALLHFIEKNHLVLEVDREIGPIGDRCSICSNYTENGHKESCELGKLISERGSNYIHKARVRELESALQRANDKHDKWLNQVANDLLNITQQNAKLREALKTFTNMEQDYHKGMLDTHICIELGDYFVTLGEIRQAKAALEAAAPSEKGGEAK